MNKRTKILAILFGAGMLYALVTNVVYPSWIKPWLTVDDRIAAKELERDKLLTEAEAIDQARLEYRGMVGRTGSFQVAQVESEVRARLNGLIDKYKLEEANVSPSRPVEDRKTGLMTSVITLSAAGSMDSVIQFLREAAELPHLARVGNAAIYPLATAKKLQDKERVNLRAPIELLVLPKNKAVGQIDETTLARLEHFPRHENRDYAQIWSRKPFSDYIPPIPLKADVAQRTFSVDIGAPVALQGKASGGDGSYTFEWSPVEGLNNPTITNPTVDTSKPVNKVYTLSVTDGTGHTEKTTVNVTVREKVVEAPPPPVKVEPPPKPVDKGPVLWPDRKNLQLAMALMRRVGEQRIDEFMVSNTRTHENKYYKVGDEFDGGRLVYVHQRGGLVHRKDGYFVYPLGATLEQSVPASDAGEYPELKDAADRHKSAVEADSLSKRAGATKPALPNGDGVPSGDTKLHDEEVAGPFARDAGSTLEGPPPPAQRASAKLKAHETERGVTNAEQADSNAEQPQAEQPLAERSSGERSEAQPGQPPEPSAQPLLPGQEDAVPNPNRPRPKVRPWRGKTGKP